MEKLANEMSKGNWDVMLQEDAWKKCINRVTNELVFKMIRERSLWRAMRRQEEGWWVALVEASRIYDGEHNEE